MAKRVMKRVCSLILCAVFVLGCVPVDILAAQEDNFCEHHSAHDDVCMADGLCAYHCELCEEIEESEDNAAEEPAEDDSPEAEDSAPFGLLPRAGEERAAHSHPLCGSSCSCSSDTHANKTWTAWDGTTTLYNGYYYLTKDITLSSTKILNNSYTSYLCLNGHSITCDDTVFDIYSNNTLIITDCGTTGKIETTNDDCTIGNNNTLSVWGGTILNSSDSYGAAVYCYNNAIAHIMGGRIEATDGDGIYCFGGNKINVKGGTIIGAYSAIINQYDEDAATCAVNIYGGNLSAYNKYNYVVNIDDGGLTMSGGYVDGDVITYDNGAESTISGGTITGTFSTYSALTTITGGTIGSLDASGKIDIRSGTIKNTFRLWENTELSTISGGNFSTCNSMMLEAETWISGGKFNNISIYDKTLYLSGSPEIGSIVVSAPSRISAQNKDLSGSYSGNPIALNLSHPNYSTEWKSGDILVKNVKSDAVADKFTVSHPDSAWMSTARSGDNLVLQVVPHGTWGSNVSWSVVDGVLKISGNGAITYESSGRYYPWYPYADQIKAIVVEPGISSIPAYTFEYLANAETISLPETLESLSLNAFQDCAKLNNLILPSSLEEISGSTSSSVYFIRCYALTDLYYFGTVEEWKALIAGKRFYSSDSEMTIHYLVYTDTTATCESEGKEAYYQFDKTSLYGDMYDANKQKISQLKTVPALGHRVTVSQVQNVDPLSVINKSATPFKLENGTYYSQNKDHSSQSDLVFTAQYDCSVEINYGVSSESGCDCLYIYHNDIRKALISGEQSGLSMTLDLKAGDTVNIRYKKDGSASKYDDRGWAALRYDLVRVTVDVEVPAESVEASCEDLVCDYCDTLIKTAAGHNLGDWYTAEEPTCAANGTKRRDCSRCDYFETDNIPTSDHNYGDDGVCSGCGDEDYIARGECGDNLTWVLYKNGELVISGTGDMWGYTTSGDIPWYNNRDSITSIVISEGATSIGSCAFFDCSNLTKITIPEGVTSIGIYAFWDCPNLKEITIPDSVTSVGGGAFDGCSNLTNVYYGGTSYEWTALGDKRPEADYVHYSCESGENHWREVSYELSCTQDAISYETCDCGYKRNEVLGETALGHDMGDWDITDATCTVDGLKRKDCSRCDYFETEVITAPGHDYGEDFICSVCGDVEQIANGICGIDLTWILYKTGELVISGEGGMYDYEVDNLPPWYEHRDSITGVTIDEGATSIGIYAFYNCAALVEIALPESLASIGAAAFRGCGALKEITVPEKVSIIGDAAFRDCTALKKVTILGSLSGITGECFYNCSSLEEIIIPEGVTEIGMSAFYECASLKKVILPDGVTTIDYCAFYGCKALEEINIPESVTTIGDYAFYHCKSLKEIALPEGLTKIGHSAFTGCSALTEIIIPKDISIIDEYVFYGCSSLQEIIISEGVAAIGNNAFCGCKALKEITIPKSVTTIGAGAFSEGVELTDVYYGGTAEEWTALGDNRPDADFIHYSCASGENHWREVSADATCAEAGYSYETCDCGYKRNEVAGESALGHDMGDWDITDATCTVDGLKRKDCSRCDHFETEVISALGHDYGEDFVCTVCGDIDCIDKGECGDNLTWVLYKTGELVISGAGDMNRYDSGAAPWYDYRAEITSVTIESGVTSISDSIFRNCNAMTKIFIPDSITNIGNEVFYGCSGLTDVYISDPSAWCKVAFSDKSSNPMDFANALHVIDAQGNEVTEITLDESVTKIPYRAFYNCKALTKITIPETVTDIGDGAFSGCSALTEITIPDSVTSIGERVFGNCRALTKITILGGITEISSYAFYDCGALTEIILPDSVTDIGDLAFGKCKALTEITIPDGVATIGDWAFFGCSALTEVIIPNSVTSIGNLAFSDCGSLSDIYYDGAADEWTALGAEIPEAEYVHYSCASSENHWREASNDATCEEAATIYETCDCGYKRNVVETEAALGHDMGDWYTVTEATPETDGEERRDCSRCDHYETRTVGSVEGMLKLEGEEFLDKTTVYVNGLPYPVVVKGDERFVDLPTEEDCVITSYDLHVGDPNDVHTQYPVGMKVYIVSDGEITYVEELDNLLQYSGASIRITGNKGIRMITSLYKDTKSALTGKGLAGYTLVEYGTVLAFAHEVEGDGDLVLGKSYSRSNYAYKKGVSDPVFANKGDLTQYTNVLVGFNLDQCKEDIAMRPYIILENAEGEQFTIYGGTIYRSIGYVAYQNRNAVAPGTAAYDFVWDIIHHVYGDQYDADYKG